MHSKRYFTYLYTGDTSEVNDTESVCDQYSRSVSSISPLWVSASCSPSKRSGGSDTKPHVMLWSASCILRLELETALSARPSKKMSAWLQTIKTKFWVSWILNYHYEVIKMMAISLFKHFLCTSFTWSWYEIPTLNQIIVWWIFFPSNNKKFQTAPLIHF